MSKSNKKKKTMKILMITPLVRQSLNKRAKERGLTPLKKNVKINQQLVKNIQSLDIPTMHTDYFMVNYYIGKLQQEVLIASTPPIINNMIWINPEWVFHILYYWDDPDCQNAFRITIGHEYAHSQDINCNGGTDSQKNFNYRVNEIFADFHASELVAKSSRKALADSCKYKLDCYTSKGYSDADSGNDRYPTWGQRKKYAEIGTFDKDLIKKIAKDANFTDEEFIEKIADAYPVVELK